MANTKGHKNKRNGPIKGQKYTKTLEWEEFGKQVIEIGMPRFLEIMQNTEDEKFVRAFSDILEYFKPKLSRNESHVEGLLTVFDGTISHPIIDQPKNADTPLLQTGPSV